MIFVTVGTNEAPFDRLVRAVDLLSPDEEVVVQHGASAVRPARARCVDFLPFEEMVDHIRSARAVVTHAGVGSIMVTLANGKRPFVVPRLKRFGEAVDDHQVGLARRMDEAGLVVAVEDPQRIPHALRENSARDAPPPSGGERLAAELRVYLSEHIGSQEPPAPG